MTGAQFEISIDGVPRTYRDQKARFTGRADPEVQKFQCRSAAACPSRSCGGGRPWGILPDQFGAGQGLYSGWLCLPFCISSSLVPADRPRRRSAARPRGLGAREALMSKINALISDDRPVVRILRRGHQRLCRDWIRDQERSQRCSRAAERVVQEGNGISSQLGDAGDVAIGSFFPPRSMRDNGRDRKMNRETDVAIRQIEFELEKPSTAWRCPMTPSAWGNCPTCYARPRQDVTS